MKYRLKDDATLTVFNPHNHLDPYNRLFRKGDTFDLYSRSSIRTDPVCLELGDTMVFVNRQDLAVLFEEIWEIPKTQIGGGFHEHQTA